MTANTNMALRDPLVIERLNELKALGLPIVEFASLGKYLFVTASGEIGGRTLRVVADSPLSSHRNALHAACSNAHAMLREIGIASEGGRDVAEVAHTAPTLAPNQARGRDLTQ
jgi:ketopantoate hydroxymethyltransferase